MKKVLSLVLVITMVLSSMSFAFASPLTDIVDNDYEEAINALVGLGIVKGYEDGTFRPEKTITRAEMAKMMVVTLGYGDLVAGSKSNFSDTQGHWADPYVALAAGKGIVVGTGDGKFAPDRIVSYNEALTMLVRGLGYTDNCNELKGMTWPTNFKVKAAELGITKDVKLASNGADRGGVAQLIDNALKTALVTVNTDGDVKKATTQTTNSNDEVVTKYVLLLSRLATSKTIAKVEAKHLDEDNKAYLGDIIDLAPYMYQEIEVYVNDDDEAVYVNDVESDVLVGEFRTATDDSGKVKVRINGKNKLYELKDVDKTLVYYNGVEVEMNELEMETGKVDAEAKKVTIVDLHKAAATFVLNDDDEIVGIIANKYTEAKRVANEYNGRTKFEGFDLPLNDDDEVDYTKLTVTGEVDSLEDIKVDDVIVLFAGAGEITTTEDTEELIIEVVRNTVEGKITRTNSDDDFYIDGTYYAESVFADYTFEVGEEGTYFLDQKGDLVDFEEEDSNEPKDYAVITELLDGVISVNGRTLVDAEMKLVNAKGEEVTYNFDDDAEITNITDDEDTDANEALIITEGTTSIDINNELAEYQVIKYTVNSKGDISKVTIVKKVDIVIPDKTPKTDITGKSYVLASNVVVFNLDGDDVEAVAADKLGEKVYLLATKDNKNGEIELMFVKGLGSSATYAYIVDEGTMLNDDDDRVQSITAYVDGVEVFYEADARNTVNSNVVDTATIVDLDLDGKIVEGATTHAAIVTDKITKVKRDRFEVDEDTWYTLADDVVVYFLDDGEFDSVGDASSIYFDAEIAGFAFDEDNIDDKIIEILFIFE